MWGVMLYVFAGLVAAVLTFAAGWWASAEMRTLRAALRIALTAVLNGVVTLVAASIVSPLLGGMIGASMIALVAYREWRVSRFSQLLLRLDANEEGSVTALFEWLDDARPEPPDAPELAVWARYVCAAAEGLLNQDYIDEAERALRLLPAAVDDPLTNASRAQYLAVIHIRRGELPHARAVLSCAPRHIPDPLMQRGVAATHALLLALEGVSDTALSQISHLRSEGGVHPSVDRLLIAASAHALARDNPEAATSLLETATSAHGPKLLERIRRDDGPASSIANAMLQEHIGPYR